MGQSKSYVIVSSDEAACSRSRFLSYRLLAVAFGRDLCAPFRREHSHASGPCGATDSSSQQARATQGWLTLDVYGTPGVSEFTGRPVMEDMRLEAYGEDIEHLLPDGIVNEVADYLLRDE